MLSALSLTMAPSTGVPSVSKTYPSTVKILWEHEAIKNRRQQQNKNFLSGSVNVLLEVNLYKHTISMLELNGFEP